MDKEVVVYIHNGILLNYKMNEIMSLAATLMDLEIIIVREIKSEEKDKVILIICEI